MRAQASGRTRGSDRSSFAATPHLAGGAAALQASELLNEGLRRSLYRSFLLTPPTALIMFAILWRVDAQRAGVIYLVLGLCASVCKWHVWTERIPLGSRRFRFQYMALAALAGLMPLVAMPAQSEGQYVLLLVILVSVLMGAFNVDGPTAAAWPVVVGAGAIIAWSSRGHSFEPQFPQVVLLVGVVLTLLLARQFWKQEWMTASLSARQIAAIDALTGFYRRQMFLDRLASSLLEESAGCVCVVDIDRFKVVNDTLGHRAGDQLLSAMAGRIESALGSRDFVGRMGGDEVAIFLPEAAHTTALTDAARIGQLFKEDFRLADHRVPVTASVGVACAQGEAASATELVHFADTAMHTAKREGSSIQLFDERMHADVLLSEQTELGLRSALRNGDVRAYLQPIVNVEDNEIVAFEALGRWHRDGKVIAAADFFQSAQQSNLLPDVTRAVASDLLDLTAATAPATLPAIGVNVEARDLGGFLDWLEFGPVGWGNWVVELTETQILDNYDAAKREVQRAADMGLDIMLDDYGTGYSSLNRILELPLTGLKIDASFVVEVEHNKTARAIVSAAVHLAQNCDLRVVAEGVESQAQADSLQELGVVCMQGYHFYRPAPIAEWQEFINSSPTWSGSDQRTAAGIGGCEPGTG